MGAVTRTSNEQCFEVIAVIIDTNVVFDDTVIVGTLSCENNKELVYLSFGDWL